MKTTTYLRKKLQESSQLYYLTWFTKILNHFKTMKSGKYHFIVVLLTLLLCHERALTQISSGFELDGNATSIAPNPPDDWDLIFSNTSNAQVTTGILTDPPPPAGVDNFFKIGSTDLDNVSSWRWDLGSVPDKNDVLHAGAALYGGNKIYFLEIGML